MSIFRYFWPKISDVKPRGSGWVGCVNGVEYISCHGIYWNRRSDGRGAWPITASRLWSRQEWAEAKIKIGLTT